MAARATLTKHGSLTAAGIAYSKINKVYFGGSLPKCKFVIEPLDVSWGEAYPEGCHFEGKPVIKIAPCMARFRDLLIQTLIHEIVHVAHPEWEHGDRFEAKMFDIRKKCFSEQLW